VAELIKSSRSEKEVIDELYLATLTRLPDDNERTAAATFLSGVASRQEGLEDLLWTLINCSEFVMSH
jgi:hypothetical protein